MAAVNIHDEFCAVCGGVKRLMIEKNDGRQPATSEEWFSYAPLAIEKVLECYCSECGIKYMIPGEVP